jgi:hypothetical protein
MRWSINPFPIDQSDLEFLIPADLDAYVNTDITISEANLPGLMEAN